MLRSLSYFWRTHLAVALAAATAAAVLTGALLVGDSVTGSLHDLALARLGGVDQVLRAPRFFRSELAAEVAAKSGGRVVPALRVAGSVRQADTGARASGVSLYGVDQGFAELFAPAPGPRFEGQSLFAPVVLSAGLAAELGAKVGDPLLLSFDKLSEVPRETLVGRADAERALASLRASVVGILPDRGAGGFQLEPNQGRSANAFLELPRLARALELPGKANLLLAAASPGPSGNLKEALAGALEAGDFGLIVKPAGQQVVVESRELVLSDALAERLEAILAGLGVSPSGVLTYLANRLEVGDKALPYSTLAGLELPAGGSPALRLVSGAPAPPLAPGEIYLNRWAAEELSASPGATVRVSSYRLGPRDELAEEQHEWRLAGVVELAGLGADPSLTPNLPGVSDALNMADWQPPFPVDLGRIRPRDEAYWHAHRAAPKAFVALSEAQALWRSRYGALTSLRLDPPAGTSAQDFAARLRQELAHRLEPAAFGLSFEPLRQRLLAGSAGATDFAQLFLAFSFFLILSAALLTGLLFRLGVEQRAREVGLLAALGYPAARIRRRFLAEGLVLALAGGLLGVVAALGYARLLLLGLATWWLPAVGTSELTLHVAPGSLVVGGLASVAMMALAVAATLRGLGRVPLPRLLAGAILPEEPAAGTSRRRFGARHAALVLGLLALGLLLTMAFAGREASPALAFSAGAAALAAGLCGFAAWAGGERGARAADRLGPGSRWRLALGNSRRAPGRSLLVLALVASACFVLVTVGAERGGGGEADGGPGSGSGGFTLTAESDVPVLQDLNSPAGRRAAGLGEGREALLAGCRFFPLRLRPGDDASCLNLYRPREPRLLGVPPDLVARGGFAFQELAHPAANPWTLLEEDLGPGVIPALADANSATWILKLKLGDELELRDEAGQRLRLRLVGLLSRSLFQRELLVAESQLVRHFPSQAGYRAFLIETPPARATEVAQALEADLAGFGFDVVASREKLAAFAQVEQTYLSTFQALGGLGLLLGTLGLGVVLLRNTLERRKELALLAALGFPLRRLRALVLGEHALLLVLGTLAGSLAALAAVAPHLFGVGAGVAWRPILGSLALVLATGLGASWLAMRLARVRGEVAALRSE